MGRVLSLAHIAGVPVEETALTIAPVATLLGAAAMVRLRGRLERRGGRAARRGRG
jgi:hypothetical protein